MSINSSFGNKAQLIFIRINLEIRFNNSKIEVFRANID